MTDIVKTGLGSFVEMAMTLFGKDVNTRRQIPLIYDGLKPVYRRAIYAQLGQGNHMRLTTKIVGEMLGTTHPHSSDSCEGPISNLVRWGICEGQGNHGSKNIMRDDDERAASRYTESRVSDKYLKIFSDMMPYVPYEPAEIEGNVEPKYLPTPIPLCLIFGTLGIGIGVNTRIPAFTVKSMFNALQNDDPNLLEAPFGLSIVKEESELDKIWKIGLGKITYTFKVEFTNTKAGRGVYIKGEPELFKPKLNKLNKLVNAGRIFMVDDTLENDKKIFIGRNYNIKSVSYDEIYEMAIEASKNTKNYRLTVTDGDKVFLIPLREWLNTTYSEYIKIVEKMKEDKVNKLTFEYKVYENLPQVVEILYKNRNYDAPEIAKRLDIEVDVVRSILQKSINTLRNADSKSKLTQIENNLNYYKNLVPTDVVNSIINEF